MILLGLIIFLYGRASSLSLNSYKLQIKIQNRYVVSLGSIKHLSELNSRRSAPLIRCEPTAEAIYNNIRSIPRQ